MIVTSLRTAGDQPDHLRRHAGEDAVAQDADEVISESREVLVKELQGVPFLHDIFDVVQGEHGHLYRARGLDVHSQPPRQIGLLQPHSARNRAQVVNIHHLILQRSGQRLHIHRDGFITLFGILCGLPSLRLEGLRELMKAQHAGHVQHAAGAHVRVRRAADANPQVPRQDDQQWHLVGEDHFFMAFVSFAGGLLGDLMNQMPWAVLKDL
mmetsp:Transcript_16235/g.38552  ORF Transcript_16235/g.38552 Transcript_16235/m.38552 type:complete len:210 (-) Transcript_16235:108-737(-)